MLPLLEVGNILMLPAGTGNDALTNPLRRNIFLVDTGYIRQGMLCVQFMVENLKANKNVKMAVISQKDAPGQQLTEGIKAGLAKYGISEKNLLILPFERGAIDFSSQIGICRKEGV